MLIKLAGSGGGHQCGCWLHRSLNNALISKHNMSNKILDILCETKSGQGQVDGCVMAKLKVDVLCNTGGVREPSNVSTV